ncbi:MAG: hypothetical protein COB07_03355 [Sulfurovum sp.]|nr:MAG: hypothetical protein COB07_03355 [Sulfurovum sp.]
MEKIIFFCTLLLVSLYAEESLSAKQQLQNNCLNCHTEDQIPNDLIFRRYLMKYSTEEAMSKAILKYLKDPQQKNSIMPHPFFSKFPMKEALNLNDATLKKNIHTFLETFAVKKKLVLPQ